MLKLFEVTGFKNFKDTFRIDFSDVRDYKFNENCIENNLLSKVIIYGKNSVGKTNFGFAMFDILSHFTNRNYNIYEYFLNSDNNLGYAEFHYKFKFNSDEIDYIYRKKSTLNLVYEKVLINSKLILEFDYEKETGNIEEIKSIAPNLNLLFRGNESLVKYVITNTNFEKSHPLYQMMNFLLGMLWFRSLEVNNNYIAYTLKPDDYFNFLHNEEALREFETFLHKAGIDEELIIKTDNDGEKRLYFKRKNTLLPFFKVASNGTKALYTFFYWYKLFNEKTLIFIDEFDAFYHYELSETIIKMLEEMKGVQIILTSHNTNLMSNKIMRPDCYFILTKDKLTSFANATERELREGHNLEKLYMSGEFNGRN